MDTTTKPAMERVTLADGLEFSRIVYGMWRLGDDADTSPAHVRAKIEACLDQGITTIDQADIYGGYMAEEILGDALKGSRPARPDRDRDQMRHRHARRAPRHARVKHYDTGRAHIEQSVDALAARSWASTASTCC